MKFMEKAIKTSLKKLFSRKKNYQDPWLGEIRVRDFFDQKLIESSVLGNN